MLIPSFLNARPSRRPLVGVDVRTAPDDPQHPLAYARILAETLPRSSLVTLESAAAANAPGAFGQAIAEALGSLGVS